MRNLLMIPLEEHIRDDDFGTITHHPSPPQFISSTGKFMDFDSRKPLSKMIKDGLANYRVKMVGVYGVGGVGKTTTVEEVCKQLENDGVFDQVVKVVVSRHMNVREIQVRLAKQLHLNFNLESEKERADKLQNVLNNGKNYLVMLDDLWEELDLREIGIPLKYVSYKGCKVILTTRDHNVLRKMGVDEYIPVEVLSEQESWNLFKKKVGINFASNELRSVAESVCKECGGLPVAILAVGGALACKEHKDIWNDALNQLHNPSWKRIVGIDEKMYASLRLSYDYLEREKEEAKSILLMCCLYHEDAEIPVNFLLFHCIARELLHPINNTVEKARRQLSTLVDSLKARSLLLEGRDGEFVKMHDVVQDVILSIAKSDERYLVIDALNEWPSKFINENLAVVSVHFNKLEDIPKGLVCPRLHTLRIECMNCSFRFPDNFFNEIGELMILELKGLHMLSIPSSLSSLSKIRTIILVDCLLEDMSLLKGLKHKLEVLIIENSKIKALPMEFGELSHLSALLVGEVYGWKPCSGKNIVRIVNGTYDNTYDTFLERAEDVHLCRVEGLMKGIFNGKGTGLLEVVHLVIKDCDGLDSLSSRTSRNQTRSFSKLTRLEVSGCSFKYMFTPSCAKELQQLETLSIEDCKMLEEIIRSEKDELDQSSRMIHFMKLKVLLLENLPKLMSFGLNVENTAAKGVYLTEGPPLFSYQIIFPSLECLQIKKLPNIKKIWHKQVLPQNSFPKLKHVEVFDCNKLAANVFPSNLWAQSLEVVDVKRCEGVEVIVSNTGVEEIETTSNCSIVFRQLTTLSLGRMGNLKSFCGNSTGSEPLYLFDPQIQFPALRCIILLLLPNLNTFKQQLLKGEVKIPAIQELEINSFPWYSRGEIHFHIARLMKKQAGKEKVTLYENTPNKTGRSSPTKHEMSTDPKVFKFISVKAGWDRAGDLQLETFYWDHFAKMHNSIKNYESADLLLSPKQEDFMLYKVDGILTRNPLHEKWGQLNEIILMAKEFPSIPEKPHCPNLGFLFLQNNRGLRRVSDSFFEDMPLLQVLDLSNTGIRSLPTSVYGLTKLQELFLRECHNLDQISPEIRNLKQLKLLDLWGTKVYNLPDEISSLERLSCLLLSFYEADEASEYADLSPNLISYRVLSKLHELKTLSISVYPVDSRWKNNSEKIIKDISELSELVYLHFYFPENGSLELFVHESDPWKSKALEKFKFVVGRDIVRVGSRVPVSIESEYNKFDRCLRFVNTDKIRGAVRGVLERTTAFYVDHLYTIESLSELGHTNFKELRFLIVRECPILVVLFVCYETTDSIFPWLEHLSLHYLWKMEQIWWGLVPSGSFNMLKKLSVHMCPKLEYVLTWSMLHCAAHLEELVVEDCESMKVIIDMEGERVGNNDIPLSNLRTVTLNLLPELVKFWNGDPPHRVQFNIYDCPSFEDGLLEKGKHPRQTFQFQFD